MQRAIEVLKRFRATADSFGATIQALATSAVREAENQEEFIRRVKEETGIRVDVVSGTEEARFIYLGVLQALPVFSKKILLIDLGGGSTEFLIGKGRSISYSNSLKLGAVRLTRGFFMGDQPAADAVDECRRFVRGMLAPVVREVKHRPFEVCVGSSGTIETIANIVRARRGESPERPINQVTFTSKELREAVEMILTAPSFRKREALPGMDADRADIMTAGALILEQIFKEFHLRQMTVSEFALREGIILEHIEKLHRKKPVEHLQNIRRNAVFHLAERLHYESGHALHVAHLALQLFDQTASLHKLGEQEREYLEAAAILHEVGLFLSHTQHHRHSYYLIRNGDLPGFLESEKEIIANVARYHRKSHPSLKHEEFRLLSMEQRTIVVRLASLLRIADGLDRTHAGLVSSLSVSTRGKKLVVRLRSKKKQSLDLELWGADRKKKLFEETFGVQVVLQT
jgi:exopolyphosphatase/guanosine-5'-triphosphate,3'-diphosphate pyrophosphatase